MLDLKMADKIMLDFVRTSGLWVVPFDVVFMVWLFKMIAAAAQGCAQ